MAGQVQVTRDALTQATTHIQNAHDEVTAQRTALRNAQATLAGEWIGDASGAFTTAFQAFDNQFAKLLTALEGIHTGVTSNRTNYDTVEASNTSSVNKIAGAINA